MNADVESMQVLADCHLRPLAEHREYPVSWLGDSQVLPILIGGIVNPFGPTLTVIALANDSTTAPPALVWASLNPFHSTVRVVGYLRPGEMAASLLDQISEELGARGVFAGGTPSFFLQDGILNAPERRRICHSLITGCSDLPALYDRLRRFPMNPWDRVTEEVSAAFDSASATSNVASSATDPLKEGELQALLDILLDVNHGQHELSAFSYAWKQSIELQATAGNHDLATGVYQFHQFTALLRRIFAGRSIVEPRSALNT